MEVVLTLLRLHNQALHCIMHKPCLTHFGTTEAIFQGYIHDITSNE